MLGYLCVAMRGIRFNPNVNLTEDANSGTYALVLLTGEDSIGMPFPAIAFSEIRSTLVRIE